MGNARCSSCGQTKPLVKAHAIPEAFFDIPPQTTRTALKLLTNKEGAYPKRAPIGVYDSGILCQVCEDRFSKVDGYAARILLHETDSFVAIPNEASPDGYEVHEYDYGLLKRFFMAVLWRASVSQHDFYAKVRLGPWEKTLAAMLEREDPGHSDDFAVVLWLYDDHPGATVTFDPFATRVDGIHCYRFRLHRYVFWIKVDKRPFPKEIRDTQLNPKPPFLVLHSPFGESQDHKLGRALVKKEAAKRGPDLL